MDIPLLNKRDNEPFLTNQFGDQYLYSLNHNTLNQLGAARVHRKRMESHCAKENTLFIVIGTDSGTLLSFLAAEDIAAGTQFILLEPASAYTAIHTELAELTLPPHLHFSQDDQFNELAKRVGINRYFWAGEVVLVKSIAAEYGFLTEYHDLFLTIQNACKQQQWLISMKLQGQPFVHAQLRNLADNVIPSSFLKNTCQGRTAILLAGGPSLDEILPWVAAHRSSLVVLAVSRISRRLLEVGLKPDLLFSIDPHQVSFEVSVEMLHFWQDALFIHAYHVSPLLLGQWRGKSVYLGHRFPWNSPLNQPSLPTSGPTVSNVALTVAMEMGFSRILLAGLDLCHSKAGFTHAAGSNERLAGPQLATASLQVPTNGGWMAETTSDFYSAIDIIRLQALQAKEKNIAIINPAAGAACIEGVEYIPLEAISLEKAPPRNEQKLATTLQIPTLSAKERASDLQAAIKELARAKGQLIKIQKLAQEALRCNEGLFGRKGKRQDFGYKLKMDKIEATLNHTHTDLSTLVKQYAAYDLLQMTKLGTDDQEWTDEEIEKSAETYYTNYKKAAAKLIRQIDQTKKQLQFRLEETSASPDLPHLFSTWMTDRLPGRLFHFLDAHPLNDEERQQWQAEIKALDEQYTAQFTSQTQSAHMQRSRDLASLQGLQGKLQLYFQKKDGKTLAQIKSALETHSDPEATRFLHLCCGLIAELEGDLDQASQSYQQLFDEQDEIFLEIALQRVAALSLARNDNDNSVAALEMLSRISPAYLVQYGDLRRLLGHSQQALTAYLDYLEKAPKDIPVMLKAAGYFSELNIPEGAREMYQHVLNHDPQNPTAQKGLARLH